MGDRSGGREKEVTQKAQVNNTTSCGTATEAQRGDLWRLEIWSERCMRVEEGTLLDFGLLARNAGGQPEEGEWSEM